MADEEAEQESGSPGGDLLELRRLRERLLELETGLRESAEPAVQAATEYCKQLCQVRAPVTAGGLKVDGAALSVAPCPHEGDEGCLEHCCVEVRCAGRPPAPRGPAARCCRCCC
uniref:Uncharacterized protein n=1 Tax=Pavo cristatus TaxID=9049 RepID=A0A8C9L777_PAVCR